MQGEHPKSDLKGNKYKEIKQVWQEILLELLAIFTLDLWFLTTFNLSRTKGKEIPVELIHNISEQVCETSFWYKLHVSWTIY